MLPENALTDNHLSDDIHELNTEIVRLAYLNIDIDDPIALHQFLSTNLPDDHEHFHKLATLKGLNSIARPCTRATSRARCC